MSLLKLILDPMGKNNYEKEYSNKANMALFEVDLYCKWVLEFVFKQFYASGILIVSNQPKNASV